MGIETAPTGVELTEQVLSDLVNPQLERWQVPGVEVTLVRRGEVLHVGGFGLADVSRDRPVMPTTLFHHGSTGKSFTALLAAALVDEGLLEWDRPVREYLANFRLHDPVATERVTVRDLLAHRSGVPRHELMWVANPSWSRAELVRRARYLESNRDLRAEFQYWNLGYVTAGHLTGVVTGSTWEEQLQTRILQPLGMSSSLTSVAAAEQQPDFARGYEVRDGRAEEVPYRSIDAAAPAGQIISPSVDSARWLLYQASQGELDGHRVVSEAPFRETRSIQIPVRFPPILPEQPDWGPTWLGYGLGWMVCTYRDRPAIWHSGGIDGFSTMVMVLTEDRSGVLVSANSNNGSFTMALLLDLTDRLLGVEPRPWFDRLHDQLEQATAQQEAEANKRIVPGTSPSHATEEYVGAYEHPAYGVLRVEAAPSGELAMTLGELDLTVKHRHYDTWTARYEPLEIEFPVTFLTDADGKIAESWAALEETLSPIRFRRMNGARLA